MLTSHHSSCTIQWHQLLLSFLIDFFMSPYLRSMIQYSPSLIRPLTPQAIPLKRLLFVWPYKRETTGRLVYFNFFLCLSNIQFYFENVLSYHPFNNVNHTFQIIILKKNRVLRFSCINFCRVSMFDNIYHASSIDKFCLGVLVCQLLSCVLVQVSLFVNFCHASLFVSFCHPSLFNIVCLVLFFLFFIVQQIYIHNIYFLYKF